MFGIPVVLYTVLGTEFCTVISRIFRIFSKPSLREKCKKRLTSLPLETIQLDLK